MMKRYFNSIKHLKTKLMILIIIPVIIILCAAALISTQAITNALTRYSLHQLRSRTDSNADSVTALLSRYVTAASGRSTSYTLERYMRDLTADSTPDKNPYYASLTTILDSIYSVDYENIDNVWIADFDSGFGVGRSSDGTTWTRASIDWQIYENSWYTQALSQSSAFISEPHNGVAVVSVVVPVSDSVTQKTMGVLAIDVKLAAIQDIIDISTKDDNGKITLILDFQNTVVASSGDFEQLSILGDTEITYLDEDNEELQELFQFENSQGKVCLGYSKEITNTSWIIVSYIPKSNIIGQISTLIWQILAIFAFIMVLFSILVSVITQMITKPLKQVSQASKEIAMGDYSLHLDISSQDEVGQLAQNVNIALKALRNRAMFDALTGIYNEFAFSEAANRLLDENPDTPFAIIRFDISRFKMVNDMFGEAKGDDILRFIASVIWDQVSYKEGCYGRIGNDVFCICTRASSEEEILDLISRLTFHIERYPINFHLTPYFGICISAPEVTLNTLLDWSSLALETIKGSTLTNYAFYSPDLRDVLLAESYIETEMESALKDGQFQLFLQPKCNMKTGKVVGAEALVRWIHPEKGIVPPDSFIPLFERNGFILKLDKYIWEETCKFIARRIEEGYEPLPISVNISRVHIFNPAFGDTLEELVEKYQIPRGLLELEFTESAFVNNLSDLYEAIDSLKKRGFTLSIDDFGSGYSCLNMLKNTPVDIIKLDKEFLGEGADTKNGRIIIRSVILMLLELNLKIIVEGVETKEQVDFLLDCGCTIAQGYYYSKPVNISSFEEFAKLH
jgi:diguanylate cyclase (GGDEF)-like protein